MCWPFTGNNPKGGLMLITLLGLIGVIADVLTIVSVIALIIKPVRHRIKEVASRLLQQMTR